MMFVADWASNIKNQSINISEGFPGLKLGEGDTLTTGKAGPQNLLCMQVGVLTV